MEYQAINSIRLEMVRLLRSVAPYRVNDSLASLRIAVKGKLLATNTRRHSENKYDPVKGLVRMPHAKRQVVSLPVGDSEGIGECYTSLDTSPPPHLTSLLSLHSFISIPPPSFLE
jgi:hypothetical protein